MKDIATPVPPEDVRGLIKKCLESAAYVNYVQLSTEVKEGNLMFLYYSYNYRIIRVDYFI